MHVHDVETGTGRWTLGTFIGELEEAGELRRWSDPVSLRDIARITEACDQAVLFERPLGCDIPLLANAMATRRRLALAFGVPPGRLIAETTARLETLVPPVRVEAGPVREVVLTGDDADLTRLPAYLQHEFDGAPYISAALDVSRHPESGRYNTGVRRLMLRGPRETGVDMVSPSDLRGYYRRARELGSRFEIAFVIGAHPLDYMSTQMRVPSDDEFAVMGALRQAPVPLVHCETVDLEVPADAEIVLEGYLEGGWDQVEGPFGEYTGCYGAPHHNPVFKLTAITRRRDAVYQTATIGGARLHHTDTAAMAALATEITVWGAIVRAVANPLDVYCPPAATGMHHVRISLRHRDPGDGRNAVVAALGCNAEIKYAVAVDDDIDITDDRLVEWAIATRFQADRDLVVLPGMRTLPLDPSLPPHEGSAVVTTKWGVDATRRFDKPRHVFDIPRPPYAGEELGVRKEEAPGARDVESLAAEMADHIAAAPEGLRFVDLMTLLPMVSQADLVHALGALRAAGRVTMGDDGRYSSPPSEGLR